MNTCKYCGATFEHSRADVEICRHCYYDGRDQADDRDPLIQRLKALPNVGDVSVHHTGGGCFGLGVVLRDGRYLFGTAVGDACLPDVGSPWTVSVHASLDAFWEQAEDARLLEPLTDDEFVAAVAAEN